MLILSLITNMFWRHPRIISITFLSVCGSFGFLIFFAVWSDVVRNIKSFLPVIASLATAFWWYRAAREMNLNSAEAREMRRKLDVMAEVTKDLKAWRTISEDVRALLKSRLSPFGGQKFRVFQIGAYDDEPRKFAQQIISALKDCGWVTTDNLMCLQSSESRISMSWGVCCYALSGATTTEELIANPTMNAMGRLCIAFLDAGIAWGSSQRFLTWMPTPNDVIEIHVGEKPPPHYLPPFVP